MFLPPPLSSSLTELFPNRGADRVVREVDVDVARRDSVKDIFFFSVDTDNCPSVVNVKPSSIVSVSSFFPTMTGRRVVLHLSPRWWKYKHLKVWKEVSDS